MLNNGAGHQCDGTAPVAFLLINAEYFHIGEKKMRQIVDDNRNAYFLLESGNRIMIKRKLFAEYLDRATVI